MTKFVILLASILFATASFAAPQGRIVVIDADTIDVDGVRVRLLGIDAPEIGQPCNTVGVARDCGRLARDVVAQRFEGQYAQCTQSDIDRYGRVVASCVVDGEDMGAAIVRAGWAWAYRRYSDAYDLDEKSAAIAERGLWAFSVQRPADYRAAQVRIVAAPDPACAIKGNISDNGQIYHVPGARGYDRTRINESSGERWFCSEAEARAAGWRRSGLR